MSDMSTVASHTPPLNEFYMSFVFTMLHFPANSLQFTLGQNIAIAAHQSIKQTFIQTLPKNDANIQVLQNNHFCASRLLTFFFFFFEPTDFF